MAVSNKERMRELRAEIERIRVERRELLKDQRELRRELYSLKEVIE